MNMVGGRHNITITVDDLVTVIISRYLADIRHSFRKHSIKFIVLFS